MQAEQERASVGPCPRSPKDKGRAVRGYRHPLWSGKDPDAGPEGKRAGAQPWSCRLTTRRQGVMQEDMSGCRLQPLGSTLVSVVHQVIPGGQGQSSGRRKTHICLSRLAGTQFSSSPQAGATAMRAQLSSLISERQAWGFCA